MQKEKNFSSRLSMYELIHVRAYVTSSKLYLNKKLYTTKLIATAEATRFTNERTDSHDTNSTLCTCTWLINPFATPQTRDTAMHFN